MQCDQTGQHNVPDMSMQGSQSHASWEVLGSPGNFSAFPQGLKNAGNGLGHRKSW